MKITKTEVIVMIAMVICLACLAVTLPKTVAQMVKSYNAEMVKP